MPVGLNGTNYILKMIDHKFKGDFVLNVEGGGTYELDAICVGEIEKTNPEAYEYIGICGKNVADIPEIKNSFDLCFSNPESFISKESVCFDFTITQCGQVVVQGYNAICISRDECSARLQLQCDFIRYNVDNIVSCNMSKIHGQNVKTFLENSPDYSECYD